MAESEQEPAQPVQESRLAIAINRIRNNQADRGDVVVEMKQAARARLELLAQDLEPVFRELPDDAGAFEFGLSHSDTPRLWIDLTTFVRMGRDPRNYEIVKETLHGRILLGENTDRETIARQVTDYVAERVLDRKRAIEGEWLHLYKSASTEGQRAIARSSVLGKAIAFVIGLLIGAAAVLTWAWFAAP